MFLKKVKFWYRKYLDPVTIDIDNTNPEATPQQFGSAANDTAGVVVYKNCLIAIPVVEGFIIGSSCDWLQKTGEYTFTVLALLQEFIVAN